MQPKKNLPRSSLHSSREKHKKYMEAIADMENDAKTPTHITFRGKLSVDHPFKAAKYIFQYMTKGTPHVQIVFDEKDTHQNNSE
jgi:hypothetical protein